MNRMYQHDILFLGFEFVHWPNPYIYFGMGSYAFCRNYLMLSFRKRKLIKNFLCCSTLVFLFLPRSFSHSIVVIVIVVVCYFLVCARCFSYLIFVSFRSGCHAVCASLSIFSLCSNSHTRSHVRSICARIHTYRLYNGDATFLCYVRRNDCRSHVCWIDDDDLSSGLTILCD